MARPRGHALRGGLLVVALCLHPGDAQADGSAIQQVYAPYVQPLERELEFFWKDEKRDNGGIPGNTLSRLGFGTSLFEGVYTEINLSEIDTTRATTNQLELEVIWQLTEQGEYDSDWGLLLEAETNLDLDINEFSIGVLNQKDWDKISLITNLVASYEWGEDVTNELESRLGVQLRYRLKPEFEPMIEVFQGPYTTAIGPGAAGIIRLSPGQQLRWGACVLKGLTPELDYAVKFELEYEFF